MSTETETRAGEAAAVEAARNTLHPAGGWASPVEDCDACERNARAVYDAMLPIIAEAVRGQVAAEIEAEAARRDRQAARCTHRYHAEQKLFYEGLADDLRAAARLARGSVTT